MKIHVTIDQPQINVDEIFTGDNATDVVRAMKARVTRELPFALRLVAGAMSEQMFAQEVVRRYNDTSKQNLPIPTTCEEFLKLAQEQGFATLQPD